MPEPAPEKVMMDRRQALTFLGVLASVVPAAACATTRLGDIVDDATIRTRVKTALLNDPEVGTLPIDVEVSGAVVNLTGRVRSRAHEQRAVELTRAVDGVADVSSSLRIEP